MLPAFLHRYFWDHPVNQVNKETHSFFIIERLLELGNDDAIRWVLRSYPQQEMLLKKAVSFPKKQQIFGKTISG